MRRDRGEHKRRRLRTQDRPPTRQRIRRASRWRANDQSIRPIAVQKLTVHERVHRDHLVAQRLMHRDLIQPAVEVCEHRVRLSCDAQQAAHVGLPGVHDQVGRGGLQLLLIHTRQKAQPPSIHPQDWDVRVSDEAHRVQDRAVPADAIHEVRRAHVTQRIEAPNPRRCGIQAVRPQLFSVVRQD